MDRKIARTLLRRLIRKIETHNYRDRKPFTVLRAYIFGSLTTDREEVGDIDVALEYVRNRDDEVYFSNSDMRGWSPDYVALDKIRGTVKAEDLDILMFHEGYKCVIRPKGEEVVLNDKLVLIYDREEMVEASYDFLDKAIGWSAGP